MSFCDIIKKYTDFFEKNFTANLTGDKIRDMIYQAVYGGRENGAVHRAYARNGGIPLPYRPRRE